MKFITRLKKVFTPKVLIITIAVIAVLVVAGYFWYEPIMRFFSDPEQIRIAIHDAGVFGPLVFILLQAAQVVIAPIPGAVTGALGGVLFDYWGILLSAVGSAIGFFIVILISRRFGRPLLEKLFSKKDIEKFDFLIGSRAELPLFLIFLFPLFPDDLVAYLAGLTNIKLSRLMWISIIAKLPTQIATNILGDQVFFGEDAKILIITSVVAVAAIVVVYFQKNWLKQLFTAEDRVEFVKQSFAKKHDKSRKAKKKK